MNITPLYELDNRLKNCMIAGTNLIMEDFRLKRAVEDIKPYAKAAPVFAKLAELTGQLLEPDRDDREELLLDAITLLDALLCTQAMVGADEPALADAKAEENDEVVKKLPQHGEAYSSKNVPYSQLAPLIEALTTSGEGHYSYVLEQHEQNPQIFSDYRVRAAMVRALGASYGELADRVESWLEEDGEDVIWLLKKDFDPAGKREMVRRVHVISEVCKEKENDFYVSMLANAKKDMREALIEALRYEPSNIDLLLSLEKTETRGMKETVLYTLADNENEAAAEPFKKLLKKKPEQVFVALYLSETGWASRLIAECMKEGLAKLLQKAANGNRIFIFDKDEEKYWNDLLPTLVGKSGTDIEEAIMETAKFADKFKLYVHKEVEKIDVEQKNTVFYDTAANRNFPDALYQYSRGADIKEGKLLGNELSDILQLMLRIKPDEGLCRLALELFEMSGENDEKNIYFGPAVLAKLYQKEDFGDWIKNHVKFVTNKYSARMPILLEVLEGLTYKNGSWNLVSTYYNERYVQPISHRLEGDFADMLMSCDGYFDSVIVGMISEENKEFFKKAEDYLYKRALTGPDKYVGYLTALKRCGCTRCDGLIVGYLKKFAGSEYYWNWRLRYYVQNLPGSTQDKVDEAMRAYELIKSGEIYGIDENWYLTMVVDELREGKL